MYDKTAAKCWGDTKTRESMDCKETQRCIHLFLENELDRGTEQKFVEHVRSCRECMEELTIEYLLLEGISRLENADNINVQKELEDKLNRAVNRQKVYKQLKAGLFLVASLIFCMFWLGGA